MRPYLFIVALALAGVACERHSAAALEGAHGHGAHASETHHHPKAGDKLGADAAHAPAVTASPAPHGTTKVTSNPAGSAPMDPHPPVRHTEEGQQVNPPKFFPGVK